MNKSNNRLKIVYFLALTFVLVCIVNVFIVSIFKVHVRSNTSLEPYIESVSLVSEKIYAKRGNIYDTNGQIVAQDERTYDIICYLDDSRKIGNKEDFVKDPLFTAQVLAVYLDMDQADIYYYLTYNPNLYQTELGLKGRNLSEETKDAIENYEGLQGIGFKESNRRIYNQGKNFAPYLIGFAQSDEQGKLVGKMGLEYYLNDELSGIDGKHIYQQDKYGYILNGMKEEIYPATNGYDVYTTIDTSIQQALQTAFDDVTSQNNASKAWGAVVEIESGKILAWGQTPSFDPNVLDIENYNNMGSQVPYEPGSVMKSFIYAAAMDLDVYNGTATFDSSPYCYLSNGNNPYRSYGSNLGCISNAAGKTWGTIELDYGLIYSSNVATSTLLSDYVGTDRYSEYLEKFGFFQNVETDGIGEVPGIKHYTWPSEKLSLTYGQGSSVTMLQLLQAYTAIFGNGEMVKPYYIDKIVDSDSNEIIYSGNRTVVSKPIKESTARQMQALLERVVSDKAGTAKYYAVDEVDIIAKTGTSEIVEGSGYNSDDSITSVMLAFPANNPQYMIYFAYVSPYDYYNHTFSTPIKDLIRRTAILTDVGYKANQNQINNTITKDVMPNLVGKSSYEAIDLLKNKYNTDVVVIGNGDKVLKQYPENGEDVYSKSKTFIVTDSDNIELADFTGWTRKEVIIYWRLSNIAIQMEDYGVAYEQSLPKGTIVNNYSEIIVKFKNIDSKVETEIKQDIQEDEE